MRGCYASMLQCRDYGSYDYFGLMKLQRQVLKLFFNVSGTSTVKMAGQYGNWKVQVIITGKSKNPTAGKGY